MQIQIYEIFETTIQEGNKKECEHMEDFSVFALLCNYIETNIFIQ